MPLGTRTLAALALSATALPVVLGPRTPHLDRLASMPPGVRLELAEALDRFDRLPADQRRAIRELDDRLERLDPEDRRRLLDLMRRYGSWVRGLDDDARRELESAPPDRRIERIRDRVGPDGTPDSPGLDLALWFRAETFNPVPLYDAATLIRVWVALDEPDRRRVDEGRSLDESLAILRALGRALGIEPAAEVRETFRVLLENQGRPAARVPRLLPEVADLGPWLLDPLAAADGRPTSGPGASPRRPALGGPQPEPIRQAAARLAAARLALLRVADLDYLRALRRRSEPATPEELAAFEARLPEWYRATLDPLPPEVVLLRLRGLRQLALADPDLRQRFALVPASASAPSPDPEPSPGRPTPGRPS